MDVEPNRGPQQIIISNRLPAPIKQLFNEARRTKPKINRYQSHSKNLLAYKRNLTPKGLTPKCTPAIHSNSPLFWKQW